MASQSHQTVEQQFTRRKAGRWNDHEHSIRTGCGYALGGNIEVRSLRAGSTGVTLSILTFKHVELEGGQIPKSDSEPPSNAGAKWLRTRLLTPADSILRIGDHVFLQVSCGTSSTVIFRTRQMAAATIQSSSDKDVA
jgi:hypothetical protein